MYLKALQENDFRKSANKNHPLKDGYDLKSYIFYTFIAFAKSAMAS